MSTLTLNVRFTAKPGHETDLREALEDMVTPTLAEAGCVAYALYLHPSDPSRVVLLEEWVDEAALAAHFETPHLKECAAILEEILIEPFQIRRFHEIA
ncbi:putative quinol monooxygenase [Nocardia sp. NPDC049707]|uniref:putative quinol monooxygenase n=1 Tax=Nocardia sp. NPDC049707 TaxID=3154735 RepID=UPI003437D8AA